MADTGTPSTPTASRGRVVLQWAVAVALLAVSWVIISNLPPTFHRYDGFAVIGSVDETTVSRTMEATIVDLVVTTHVSGERGGMQWEVDGDWVVIDVVASAREDGVAINYARLVVDGVSYPATDRADSLFGQALRNDFAQSGSLAFQVPPDILGRDVNLEIGTPTYRALDVLLDDVITIPLDLATLPRVDEAIIRLPEWVRP